MTAYQNGVYFEMSVMNDLRDAGYTCVRSAGSKGAADLVAVKPGSVVFVQAKSNGAIGPTEWNLFLQMATEAGAVPVVAFRPGRGKVQFMRIERFKTKGERRPWVEWVP